MQDRCRRSFAGTSIGSSRSSSGSTSSCWRRRRSSSRRCSRASALDLPLTQPPPATAVPAVRWSRLRSRSWPGTPILGWAGLSLIYLTVRHRAGARRALPRTAGRGRLRYDATCCRFGNIALASALAPAGIIVIFLLGPRRAEPLDQLDGAAAGGGGQPARAAAAAARHPPADVGGQGRACWPTSMPGSAEVYDEVTPESVGGARDPGPQRADQHADPAAQDRPRDDDLAVRRHGGIRPGGPDRQRAADLHGAERAHQALLDRHRPEP